MKKAFIILAILALSGSYLYAQVPKPERRDLNLGLSNGLGGVSYSFFPSLDLSYKTTSFRLSPGFVALSAGVTQELFPISDIYYQWKWVVSGYYFMSKRDGTWPGVGTFGVQSDDVNRFALLTGLKMLIGSRFYSYLQFGILHSRYSSIDEVLPTGIIRPRPAFVEWLPYLEFSIGINLFRNYTHDVVYAD
ncbi:MAG: hypothetical protein ACK4ND_09760 [Cytophagaceae bacterium]